VVAEPILKYPGSKRTLVPVLRDVAARVAPRARRLVVPFLGSCADTMGLSPRFEEVLAADNNADLVGLYRAIVEDPVGTWEEATAVFTPDSTAKPDVEVEKRGKTSLVNPVWLELREWVRSLPVGHRDRSTTLPLFSQSTYNGVLRYNKRGQLNSPCGLKHQNPVPPTLESFLDFARWARGVDLRCADFRGTILEAGAGDLVVLDPPYVRETGKKTSFTSYSPAGPFRDADQRDLVDAIHAARKRGATVLCFNHDTPASRELYAAADEFVPLSVRRSVSRDGNGRAPAAEILAVFLPRVEAATDHAPVGDAGAVVSFFSGMGALDLGFERSGFRTVLAVEANPRFANAYVHARKQMRDPLPLHGVDVRSVEDYLVGEGAERLARIVAEARDKFGSVGFIGGPPCPDFSVAGKQAGAGGNNGRLLGVYVDLVLAQQPDWFLLENVKGLVATEKHRAHFDEVCRRLEDGGYRVAWRLLNAVQFGVPQFRERVLLVGFREGGASDTGEVPDAGAAVAAIDFQRFASWPGDAATSLDWPSTSAFAPDEPPPWPAGLPEAARELTPAFWFERNAVDRHPDNRGFAPKSARMSSILEGDVAGKSFKRLHRWRPSPAAAYGKNEVHLHPWEPRRLTVAESLAIQSMPQEFSLPPEMALTDCFKTVGNAVPYLMACGLAKAVSAAMERGRAAADRPSVPSFLRAA
jgi:DNA (cytosine-5)-methyltransferase 1